MYIVLTKNLKNEQGDDVIKTPKLKRSPRKRDLMRRKNFNPTNEDLQFEMDKLSAHLERLECIPEHMMQDAATPHVRRKMMTIIRNIDEIVRTVEVDKLEAQSGIQGATTSIVNGTKQQNVTFSDQHAAYKYDVTSVMDPTRATQDTTDATLENFFSRPLKIATFEWRTNTNLFEDFDPWTLYWTNPRVVNRITNFNLLRCKLHLKIILNGNGFHYGRAIASYLPLALYDSVSENQALVTADIVQRSQMPHLYLNPTTSTGGDMVLPFFMPENNISIPNEGWEQMGAMNIRSINTLKHANGADDKVTISVFAWAEDCMFSGLTSAEPDALSPQSGSEVDMANKTGVVSGPATTVAKAAGVLANIPPISPFMLATQRIANTVAGVAKVFGFSRPPVTKNPEPYKPLPVSSLATTNTPDGVQKMTVDEKQELSIDPRIAGLGGEDTMDIASIAQRESYLTTFGWDVELPPGLLLWNGIVSPVTWAQSGGSPNIAYHFPACAMAALPFKYWTGTMKFRFQVVSSAFHKGRLRIFYDPNFVSSSEFNVQYSHVMDIADQTDFTMEIGNGQNVTLLDHLLPGDNAIDPFRVSPYTSAVPGNGVVGVEILNELTVPDSTINNGVQINVFVSAGDDFEVFVPDDHFQKFVFKPTRDQTPQSGLEQLEAQSGEQIIPDAMNTTELSAPQQEQTETLGPGKQNDNLMNKVFTGESIRSFRSMLKRYTLHSMIGSLDNTQKILYGRRSMFPYLRGDVSGAVDLTADDLPYNFCNTMLMHWVTYAFSGWRGSIRWKILPTPFYRSEDLPVVMIQRCDEGDSSFDRGEDSTFASGTQSSAAYRAVLRNFVDGNYPTDSPFIGTLGMVYQNGNVNPVTEFEVPYYQKYRFTPGKRYNYTTEPPTWDGVYDYRIFQRGQNTTYYNFYCASGEDFQTYFFTGLPRLYYEDFPPDPKAT